jgi:hypothetical protein
MSTAEPLLDPNDKILILTPAGNSHLKDFDHVFLPESRALQRIYGSACRIVRVPVAPIEEGALIVRRGQPTFVRAAQATLAALGDGTPWTHVVILCHGWATGIQLGFRCRGQRPGDSANLDKLIDTLRALPLKCITLFACSAGADPHSKTTSPGSGDGSFSDMLRDAVGVPVIAHVTVGHATRNPNLIMFEASPSPLVGGLRLPIPKTALFRNAIGLLNNKRRNGRPATGDRPPRGHTRPAFASIPLCTTAAELQALLSAVPA